MRKFDFRPEEDALLVRLRLEQKTWKQARLRLNRSESSCRRRWSYLAEHPPAWTTVREFEEDKNGAVCKVTTAEPVKTLADAIAVAEVDTGIWQVKHWKCKQWTTPLNIKNGQAIATLDKGNGKKVQELKWEKSTPIQQQQYLVEVTLERKKPMVLAMETLLKEIKSNKLILPTYNHSRPKNAPCRALEVSVMDPHLGMRSYKPQSDHAWSMDECEDIFMATTEKLLELALPQGPFEQIVAPIGNDFLHADNLDHTTTGGTPQPEMDCFHEVYMRGEKLMLWFVERLRKVAPVHLVHVPGNHDKLTSFVIARMVKAVYEAAGATDVTVDASPSPYKFWKYGVTLLGFEHGHSVDAIRLGALMANEMRGCGWADARYCEWHLGDQHRKGSGKPSKLEEQGVSVEYLPALTPPNEWHRRKSYNWQKRGAMAFVYDKLQGPQSRHQVNIDSYTGKHMGL